MASEISPKAEIDPRAKIGNNCKIYPFAYIEGDVVIGDNCTIYPYVSILNGTRMGNDNTVFQGAVLAALPQDFEFKGEPSELIIGDRNTFPRERGHQPRHPLRRQDRHRQQQLLHGGRAHIPRHQGGPPLRLRLRHEDCRRLRDWRCRHLLHQRDCQRPHPRRLMLDDTFGLHLLRRTSRRSSSPVARPSSTMASTP